ncbi:MAG TPA: cyanophycinase [Gemmatimonadaceae bacterium]|nr:cyanophycinase [Gemmatimonadaceae bacterium]
MRAVLAVLIAVPSLLAAQGRGSLYIVGGGPQPPALVQEFVDLAGGRGKANIVVFAMASVNGEKGGEEKAEQLRGLGATARNVWITREQAATDSVAKLLDGATGIWFGGGDQNRLTEVIKGTATERAIHRRYAAGAVIGGTSAGAAVMSALMITGDERAPGGLRPDSTLSYGTIARSNVVVDSGFALIGNAVIDQHFLRRKRHNRLVSLVLERAPHLGAGIDESTALVVRPDGTWGVSGASVVVVYDARRANITGEATATLGAGGIAMHVLPAGSRFDPKSGKAALPASKGAQR